MSELQSRSNIASDSPRENCVPRRPSRRCLEQGILNDSQHYQPFKFRHDTLDDPERQIRLLRVLSSSDDDKEPLSAELSTWYRDKAPPYKAISYTWGENSKRLIYVNEKCHIVTPNCAYVLWQSSKHSPGEYVWVDSACINQATTSEKNHQVKIMMSIYQQASQVLVCIGPHSDDSGFVCQVLSQVQELYLEAERDPDWCKDDNHIHQKCWEPLLATISEAEAYKLCHALGKLLERPYWERLWVVQEFAGAKVGLEVLCGTSTLSWSQMKLLSHLIGHGVDPEKGMHHTLGWVEEGCTRLEVLSDSLFELMRVRDDVGSNGFDVTEVFDTDIISISDRKCTDPRDRVFGLLGLVKWPEGMEPIVPDYHDSIIQLAVRMARVLGDLFIIKIVISALGIHGQQPEIRAWITERERESPQVEERSRLIDGRHDVLQIPIFRHGLPHGGFLRASDDGRLTLQLIRTGDLTTSSSPSKNLFGEQIDLAKYPCRPLFESSEIIGAVCESAQAGDLVVDTGYRYVALVLRHNTTENAWDIVGQGILLYDAHNLNLAIPIRVDVKLTPEDTILFMGQDLIDQSDWDLEARLECLGINPATFPKGAAKVTFEATDETS